MPTWPRNTSSTMTPTAASMLSLPLVLPMPRIETPVRRAFGVVAVRPGARWVRSATVNTRSRSICVAADHGDRNRHVLRALGAVARRDDELLERPAAAATPARRAASSCACAAWRRVGRPRRRPRPVATEPAVTPSPLRLALLKPCSLHAPSIECLRVGEFGAGVEGMQIIAASVTVGSHRGSTFITFARRASRARLRLRLSCDFAVTYLLPRRS